MIRFWLVGLTFWPVFIIGVIVGHWFYGSIVALVAVLLAEALTFRLTFGHWPNLRSLRSRKLEARKPSDTNEPPIRQ